MQKLISYFNPHLNVSLYEQQKGKAFVVLNLVGFILISIIAITHFIRNNENLLITQTSLMLVLAVQITGLLVLKKRGIKIAGNVFSFLLIVAIAASLNILSETRPVFFKYLQGFYSALMLLVVSGLLATRKIMFINTLIIFLTVTRVYVYSIEHSPEHFHLFRTAYIQYSVVLAGISAITYFTIRFAENAIRAAQEDARIKEQQNQDLLASEEEIRANNEELKATTDALRESYDALEHAKHRAEESNKLKSLFLSNISHEVRTPMNGIIGFSKLLDAEGVDQESKKKFTDIIIKSSEQLLKIIEDIIEVSVLETKKAKLEFSQVNLNHLSQNLIDVFNLKKVNDNVELKLEKGLLDEDAVILTDETRLLKILNNLVENAVKFTEKGFVRVAYKVRNTKIEFEVQDTGIGMDKEKTFDIFDRFVQADENISKDFGGLGLGLAIARENAVMLGGDLHVESKKNEGSVFRFEIDYKPVTEKQTLNEAQKAEKKYSGAQKQYKLLVAEDEEVNFYYISQILKFMVYNFDVHHARNGEEVLEICQKEKPDLILMDIKMPVLNGLEATKIIKQKYPGLKVIAQTAYSTDEEREKTLAAGCDDFITKPISFDTLKEILEKYLIEEQVT